MHKFTLCSSAAPIVLLVACSPKPSDETIAQDIEKRVSTEPRSQQAQVKVEAKQGNVTLTGRAKTEAARQEIEKIARDEHGVTNVEDQVSVEPEECLLSSMVIQAGSPITGTVKEAKKAGRFKGGAVLVLTLDSVTMKGHQ